MKLVLKLILTAIIFVSCSDNSDTAVLNTQNLPENIKKRMRDSIDFILVDSLVANKKINELPYYYSMYHIDTLNTKYLIKYADQLGLAGQYNVSFNLLNKAIRYTKNNAKLYNCKGNIWQYIAGVKMNNREYYKNEMDSSVFYYEKACQTDSNDVELFVTMCLMYDGLGRHDEGIKAIEHAMKLQPTNGDHILFRGVCKIGLKDYKGAYEDLRVITAYRKSDANMYFNRAVAESSLKMIEMAKLDLDTCVMLEPNNSMWHYYRGVCMTNIKSQKRNGFLEVKKAHDMGYPVPEHEYKHVMKKLSEVSI
ncbi:MAG: hypothetical protein Q7W45_18270 [Bacteroidota bacterium]|nr:hypothetical protein [Bacteroidota bacterium]MDP3147478.1 hypothetical protein [Bacteroidota bacterium]